MSVWILILEIPTFLRPLLLGLLSPNSNGRGICIRTYVYFSTYKIIFGLCVRTEQFPTVRKLECCNPTKSFSFVKKNYPPKICLVLNVWYVGTYTEIEAQFRFCHNSYSIFPLRVLKLLKLHVHIFCSKNTKAGW